MDPAPRLACQQCKQRKLRCDKGSPCNSCSAAGLACQIVQRARLPRGKSGAKQTQEQSLEARLKQLEALFDQRTKVKLGKSCRLLQHMTNLLFLGDCGGIDLHRAVKGSA